MADTINAPLYADNRRAAGLGGGCLAYAVAAAIVCALLAIPAIVMLLLGWIGGAR